jgi:flagellum-specific ATP synthase
VNILKKDKLQQSIFESLRPSLKGKITGDGSGRIDIKGIDCEIGTVAVSGNGAVLECIGFKDETSFFLNQTGSQIIPGDFVRPVGNSRFVQIPSEVLGRVIDSEGFDLSDKNAERKLSIDLVGKPINPMERPSIKKPLDVGVNSINGFMSVGVGQRIGIMAGSGVGKSVLLGMITRFTSADVIIVSLVGERGREVQDFIDENLNETTKHKCTIVAEPANATPLKKIKCAELATSIAEKYRDEGKNVLLLMDSITRYANAYREVLLSSGELPVNRGYPSGVFSRIYSLIERAGNTMSGSITGIYTVLVEGDDLNDPISDNCRGILDGHIVLSRDLADAGVYPAIDISKSISRVMNKVTLKEHQKISIKLKSLYSTYQENKDLISMGYEKGSDPMIDLSIETIPLIMDFLKQPYDSKKSLKSCLADLRVLASFQPVNE